MNAVLSVAALWAGCYLVGALPFGYLVGRLKGIDIRTMGSCNIGATNVGRVLGRPWGLLVFGLDVGKGLGPVVLAGVVLHGRAAAWDISTGIINVLWLGAGICGIVGHMFPVYLNFSGGKGVATSLGVVLGFFPYLTSAGLLAFGVWLAVTLVSRYVSLGSVCAALALPPLLVLCTLWHGYAVLRENVVFLMFSVIVAILVVYRHRANLQRLRAGTERRIGRSA